MCRIYYDQTFIRIISNFKRKKMYFDVFILCSLLILMICM